MKTTFSIKRTFYFDAAHYIPNHPTCGCVHGHTWKVEVELGSEKLNKESMVLDFKKLKTRVEGYIDNYFDHKNLNQVEMFTDIFPPTAENLAFTFCANLWDLIEIFDLLFVKVSIQEGNGGTATCKMEK